MSRIGKMPVTIPTGVTVDVQGSRVAVKGPKGELSIDLPDPAFVEEAVFRFGIDRVSEHFHIPFKFTPWGFSLFRGGA